jgi:hypothetical protein
MKWIKSLLCVLLLTTLSCSKNDEPKPVQEGTKFPTPDWKQDTTGRYPASMTSVLTLPTSLAAAVIESDQLAAFVNDECRGVGTMEKVNAQNLFFVMIHGMPDETSKVKFKYYSGKTSYMYESKDTLNFLIDAIYGTAQNPKTLQLSQLK